jgi:drug/metabolite transporter (DMT)-like permease
LRLLPAHLGPFEGEVIGVLAFTLAGALWALLPLWDRRRRDGRMRAWVAWVGVVVVGYIVGMTIWGYLA